MEEQSVKDTVQNERRLLLILWGSMLLTLIVYLAIPRVLGAHGPIFPGDPFSNPLRAAFWTVMLGEIVFLIWWNRRFLSRDIILRELTAGEGMSSVLSGYRSKKIIALAIAESVAIYGLVLALTSSLIWDQYIFTLISGALLVHQYPSAEFFDTLERECGLRAQSKTQNQN